MVQGTRFVRSLGTCVFPYSNSRRTAMSSPGSKSPLAVRVRLPGSPEQKRVEACPLPPFRRLWNDFTAAVLPELSTLSALEVLVARVTGLAVERGLLPFQLRAIVSLEVLQDLIAAL